MTAKDFLVSAIGNPIVRFCGDIYLINSNFGSLLIHLSAPTSSFESVEQFMDICSQCLGVMTPSSEIGFRGLRGQVLRDPFVLFDNSRNERLG